MRPADLEGADHGGCRQASLPPRTSHGAYVGRTQELGALDRVLDEVAARGARVVLLRGPAGIGKTALLRRFVERHPEATALRADGGGPPAPYRLIAGLLGRTGVRARVLPDSDVLASADGPAVVGRRALQAIVGLARERPLALVVDDADRADVESLRATLFVLRRLAAHPVLTMLTCSTDRAWPPEGLARLAESARTGLNMALGPLRPAEVRELAATRGVSDLPLSGARRMCAHTQGNPRHLLALLAELPVGAWAHATELPAPRGLIRSVDRVLSACREETRRLVEAVAALGGHAVLSTAADVADVADALAALEEACAVGLLARPAPDATWYLTFPDPLTQAAVRGQLGPARRMRLHRAAVRGAGPTSTPLTPPSQVKTLVKASFSSRAW